MKKTVVPAIALCLFSLSMAAQSRTRVSARQDLNSTLTDLERVAESTHTDISSMRIDKWGASWKPGFLGKSSHTKDAQHLALSLKRNLIGVLPQMISDARSSRGSMSTTFKLYDDVSVLCETLDSLVSETEQFGKKEEYGPLADDFSAMSRIRRNLSVYLEQKASAMEGRSGAPAYASSYSAPASPTASSRTVVASAPTTATSTTTGTAPNKIIIDDTVPEQKPAKKKSATQYSNVY